MRITVLVLLLSLGCPSLAWAQGESPTATQSLEDRVRSLEERIEQLESIIERQQEVIDTLSPAAPPAEEPVAPEQPAGGRYLQLPDISFIVESVGLAGNDSRQPDRDRLRVRHGELGIQSYVYPSLKADAFVAMSPQQGVSAQLEEAYLTYTGLGRGLNGYVGQKHVPFGRTNLVHSHSWLYVNPPLALTDLVSHESLTGEGLNLSYLLPTKGDLFAQFDVGTWTPSGHSHEHEETGDTILAGEGAGFHDHFQTARLWASRPFGRDRELELGGSWARGLSEPDSDLGPGHVTLRGLDLTYRQYGTGAKRLLLRGEQVWRKQSGALGSAQAQGYYLFANNRLDKYNDVGLLYSWSQFPQAPDLHEQALSLILTRQFTEQYYLRLQANRGSRPGKDPYHELYLQWVWGVGPHTHNLE